MVAEVAPPRLTVVSTPIKTDPTPPKLPVTFTVLNNRCSNCGGNVYAEQGELKCLMCPVHFEVDEWSYDLKRDRWRIVRLTALVRSPKLSRIGHLEERRIYRELSGDQGTSRAARILALVPEPPEYVTASKILKRLSIPGHQVYDSLNELIAAGHVRVLIYNQQYGYRGYQRATRSGESS